MDEIIYTYETDNYKDNLIQFNLLTSKRILKMTTIFLGILTLIFFGIDIIFNTFNSVFLLIATIFMFILSLVQSEKGFQKTLSIYDDLYYKCNFYIERVEVKSANNYFSGDTTYFKSFYKNIIIPKDNIAILYLKDNKAIIITEKNVINIIEKLELTYLVKKKGK